MTSTPMVETIARAIYEADPVWIAGGPVAWGDLLETTHQAMRVCARAALSALSTPTEGMVEAASTALMNSRAMAPLETTVWQAMIQSALNEGKA